MKLLRELRVIPVVLIAILGLVVLKVAGLVIDGGYVFDYQPNSTKRSWAQESFNFPGRSEPADITGSVLTKKDETPAKPALSAPETAPWAAAIAWLSLILAWPSRSLPSSSRDPLAAPPPVGFEPLAVAMPAPPAASSARAAAPAVTRRCTAISFRSGMRGATLAGAHELTMRVAAFARQR